MNQNGGFTSSYAGCFPYFNSQRGIYINLLRKDWDNNEKSCSDATITSERNVSVWSYCRTQLICVE